MRPIEAAGGLLWRASPEGPRLALVHRPRRRDWSLPKGKLEPGETFEEAALREVLEETGCEARLGPLAGVSLYEVGGHPKVVVYWHMELLVEHPFTAGEEIDAVAWLAPRQALARLDHPSERDLVSRPARPFPVGRAP
ncbi:MAG TPA: NUDIX hydrolase [Anaeromyxobacteraceae bacterium]|nr:NUDIX hydrolase [Anaeromyxobacteraceae bacterium]